jgi:hypothetical protein
MTSRLHLNPGPDSDSVLILICVHRSHPGGQLCSSCIGTSLLFRLPSPSPLSFSFPPIHASQDCGYGDCDCSSRSGRGFRWWHACSEQRGVRSDASGAQLTLLLAALCPQVGNRTTPSHYAKTSNLNLNPNSNNPTFSAQLRYKRGICCSTATTTYIHTYTHTYHAHPLLYSVQVLPLFHQPSTEYPRPHSSSSLSRLPPLTNLQQITSHRRLASTD